MKKLLLALTLVFLLPDQANSGPVCRAVGRSMAAAGRFVIGGQRRQSRRECRIGRIIEQAPEPTPAPTPTPVPETITKTSSLPAAERSEFASSPNSFVTEPPGEELAGALPAPPVQLAQERWQKSDWRETAEPAEGAALKHGRKIRASDIETLLDLIAGDERFQGPAGPSGPAGPRGPEGPQGPAGPPGSGSGDAEAINRILDLVEANRNEIALLRQAIAAEQSAREREDELLGQEIEARQDGVAELENRHRADMIAVQRRLDELEVIFSESVQYRIRRVPVAKSD